MDGPPDSVIAALGDVARKDPAAKAWVINLDRHYDDLDKCAAAK